MSAVNAIASSSSLQTEDDVTIETLLVSDATSRQLRHILHRNSRERAVGERQAKTLEHQRKNKQSQLAREEKEIRERLQRLHQEQKVLTQLDCLQDEAIQNVSLANISAVSIDDISLCEQGEEGEEGEEEETFINPYPVALKPSTGSGSNSGGSTTPYEGVSHPFHHGRRRVSIEFEDLDIHSSTGKVMGPARSRSMKQLSLFLSDSTISLGAKAANNERTEEWIGSPEAIHSIRRPRKSIAQQRLEKLIARSNNHQKDENSERRSLALSPSSSMQGYLNRSQSLKERPRSQSRASIQASCSRSNSWKERGRRNMTKSVESMTEELHFLDLISKGSKSPGTPRGRRGGSRSAILSRQSSSGSLRDYVATPETKSSVWGFVSSVQDQESNLDGSLFPQQRARCKHRVTSGDSIQLPPIATEGSTGIGARCRSTSPLVGIRGTNSREGSFKKII